MTSRTSLTSGTNRLEHKLVSITIKEVKTLLKSLRDSGVETFEGFGLRIAMSSTTTATDEHPVRQTKASAKKAADIEQLSFLQDNADVVDDNLANAIVENPAEYERLLIEGELEDAAGPQDRGPESPLQ